MKKCFLFLLLFLLLLPQQVVFANEASEDTSHVSGYDFNNDRVTKGNGTATTTYANKYYTVASATTTKHVFDNQGTLLATIEGNGTATSTNFVHTDHLGSTDIVVDEDGDVVEETDYFPFGAQRVNTTNTGFKEQKKFTGYEYDTESDLHYAKNRYYDQDIGKFLSQDPFVIGVRYNLVNPQAANSYSYALNNPLRYTDPSGQSAKDAIADAINAVKGIVDSIKSFFGGSSNSLNQQSLEGNERFAPINSNVVQGPINPNSTWDPVTDQRINDLDPKVVQPARNFINNTELQTGNQLRVTQGYRSNEEQNRLYAQGRTTPGPIITNAKEGQSAHNYGIAIDVVIMRDGSPDWSTPISPEIANYGTDQGFDWGGNWVEFNDPPHFEMKF